MTIPYIIKSDSVTLFLGGAGATIASDHINFTKIVEKLYAGDTDVAGFKLLIDVAAGLGASVSPTSVNASDSEQSVTFDRVSGTLKYKGYPLHGYVAAKATELYKAGSEKPLQKFLAFLENLYRNPRSSIADRLYRFLEVGNMPITDDGYFLAYKKIRNNWKDIHSNTMLNQVGMTVEMPRVLVNDKDTDTCSTGLHFCSYEYLSQFSSSGSDDRVVVLKIDPADVVSIPTDYNDTKGRACKYVIQSEITQEVTKGPVLSGASPVVAANAFEAPVPTPVEPTTTWPHPVLVVMSYAGSMPQSDVQTKLAALTNAQLVEIYNQMAITPIDHFRDKQTGVRRLLALTDRKTLEAKLAQY